MTDTRPIVFENVQRRFNRREVLRGLDLTVHAGQIHAFLGRNGSGKTTALRILLGFLQPHGGRSTILGVNSQRLSPDDRERIGYVSEEHRLYRWMRVQDVVDFEAGTRQRFDRALAHESLRRCGLAVKQRVGSLSRGQRAQVALIVAVASRPDVLVFDDPALGLDVVMRREFLDVMIDLLSGRGVTVLFSSHFLTDVERIADRISLLHEGRLIVDATMDDLKARVQTRFWRPVRAGELPPTSPRLLRSRPRRDGFELTLLDLDVEQERRLREAGTLSDASTPTLEDLFLSLTRPPTERMFDDAGVAA